MTEPDRVAREFKRRVGDPTPLMLGGTPYSAQSLMAKLLHWVMEAVAEREGGPAYHVAVTHPANWGPYKKELLNQTVSLADINNPTFVTEPEAAARVPRRACRVRPSPNRARTARTWDCSARARPTARAPRRERRRG